MKTSKVILVTLATLVAPLIRGLSFMFTGIAIKNVFAMVILGFIMIVTGIIGVQGSQGKTMIIILTMFSF